MPKPFSVVAWVEIITCHHMITISKKYQIVKSFNYEIFYMSTIISCLINLLLLEIIKSSHTILIYYDIKSSSDFIK